jgi:imidazolonepropionase
MFYSAHGHYAPARRMIDAGCAVALASDLNPGSSQVYSLPFVMALAALHMQMSAEECLSAVTINAAHALGIADMAGELSPGRRADISIFDVPDYHDIPCHIGADLVRDVFIRGRIVKRQHRMVLGS